ncbi:MAG TPA: hypothetical protein VGX70_01520 [Gemmataceae bacterium]|nr:hypothetical protein [Gemmataceae bacterium]
MDPLADVRSHLEAAASQSDYVAVNTLWLALLKLANLEDGKSELARMVVVVGRIPVETVASIVSDRAVDALLNLDPPLETVVSHPREQLETAEVIEALNKIRAQRTSAPREALAGLGFVLKAIRNKREHGFKTQAGRRDAEILHPARQLLGKLSQAALESRVSDPRPAR